MSCVMSAAPGTIRPGARTTDPYDPDLSALDASRRALVCAASEALSVGAGHLPLDPNRSAGALPDCDRLAADLETKARALLLQPRLSAEQEQRVTGTIRCIADLRCVVRGAREVAQLSRLVMTDAAGAGALAPTSPLRAALGSLGDATAALAHKAAALGASDGAAARGVAAAYRDVDAARAKAEAELRAAVGALPAGVLRVIRGMIWSVMVAAENITRIAARLAGVARCRPGIAA